MWEVVLQPNFKFVYHKIIQIHHRQNRNGKTDGDNNLHGNIQDRINVQKKNNTYAD